MTTTIHTWWSAGGGVGKTTLAIIHAAALAEKYPGEVVLLDFKEVTPHIGFIYDLEINAGKLFNEIESNQLTKEGFLKYLNKKYGIWIMPGIGLNDFRFFSEKHFYSILSAAGKSFNHIVIDTNESMFFAGTVVALNVADKINVITNSDLTKIKDTKTLTDFIIQQWGVDNRKIQYFINDNLNKGFNEDFHSGVLMGEKFVPYDKEASQLIAGEDPRAPEVISLLANSEKTSKKKIWLRGVSNACKSLFC